ncbi:MAG: PepSY-associated TM helix domain-containing protein [Verrucomicrobia bacterium]|nr:PepSY-associated TM helix domain-containing protein [Verrucomicrobiota bacterium]
MNATEHRRRLLKKWSRTFHIYLSMLGLLGILFFAITGLMLNHPEWFGLTETRMRRLEGIVPPALLQEPDKLAVVEKLRQEFSVRGALDSFEIDEDQITVIFKSPTRRDQAVIDRRHGRVQVMMEGRSAAARFAELHRGVEAGSAWRLVIDVVAAVQIISALTGMLLWWLVPRWRPLGLTALAVCLSACALVYFAWVP